MSTSADTDRARFFKDGTRRVQRNFGITEDLAEWLRVTAFKTNKSQSAIARDAFEHYRRTHPNE